MDTLLNIRAFLAIADAGSLSAAARKLGVAPSVISKRIGRLEDEMGLALFARTTRKVEITPSGARFLPRYRVLVQDLDDTLKGAKQHTRPLEGSLRIKSPITVALAFFGRFFADFQARHPGIEIDLTLLDKSVNPNEEGFDLALGALPMTYPDITDIFLCEYPRVLCASPDYLAERGWPEHPRDLVGHACINLQASGTNWLFEGEGGDISVPIHSRFTVNDAGVLHDAACRGRGVAIIGEFVAHRALEEGRLVRLLPSYPVKMMWLKAMVPTKKITLPIMQLMIDELKAFTQPEAPWLHIQPAIEWTRQPAIIL
jgi:DNA-binding transcriptional LysR family regulator